MCESVSQNYKQTEIGLIPEDWEVVRLGEVAEVKAGQSAPQGEKYFQNGKYPFIRVQHIDNTDYRITNWDLINDLAIKDYRLKLFPKGTIIFPKSGAAVYLEKRAMLPFDAYIVSHLCAVNSKKSGKAIQKFLFYFLIYEKLAKKKAEGYPTLNLSEIKEIKIPLPPLSEQQKIAKVLDKIQQAIEIQDRIIEQAKKLKKSLMQKLFTEGLYGEEQKETEIGLIPKSWEVVRLGEVVEFSRKPRNLRIRDNDEVPFIPMELISDEGKYAKWVMKKYSEISSGTFVLKNDIIVAKITPSFENGKQALLTNLPAKFGYATTEVIAFHLKNNEVTKEYIFEYLRIPKIRTNLTSKMEGTTGRRRLPRNILENLLIPLPSLEEQKQIVHILCTVDKKIEIEQRRKQVLKELFKTMLHKLMSGETRLKEVEV